MMGPLQQAAMISRQGLPMFYDTTQANEQAVTQTGNVGGKTREQLQYEEAMRQQRMASDIASQQGNAMFTANMGNAAANANTARGMAVNAQQALNNVYQMAGDRLNTAAANTMGAINNAGQIAAGMFR